MGVNKGEQVPEREFSGHEFFEKIFQWTFELPDIQFNAESVGRLYFKNFISDSDVVLLLESVDALSYRKWIRIANRVRMKGVESKLANVWLSIFLECFPKAEKVLRKFPDFGVRLLDNPDEFKDDEKKLYEDIIGTAEKDDTFFRYPGRNVEALENIKSEWEGGL